MAMEGVAVAVVGPTLLKIFEEYPSISGGISSECLAKISVNCNTPFETDLEYLNAVEAIFYIKHMFLKCRDKIELYFIKENAKFEDPTASGVKSLVKIASGYQELIKYTEWLIEQRLQSGPFQPRVVRLGKKTNLSQKEINALVFLVLGSPQVLPYTTTDFSDMVKYCEFDAKEALNFVSPSREHVKHNILFVNADDPVGYSFKISYVISCILSGLETTEEEFLKIDKTILASVLLEEDPLKYHFLTHPGGLGKSTDPDSEKEAEAEEDKESEKGEGEGTEEGEGEGEEGEKKEKKAKKDDRDIFELIREEVENEKQLLAEMEDQDTEGDDKKLGAYTNNIAYMSDHVEWLAALIKLKEVTRDAYADRTKDIDKEIQIREMKAKERMLRSKCERRVAITASAGKWKPRLEKLAAHLQLVQFEKHVLLLLTANVLSPKVSPDGGYSTRSVDSFNVGQIINLFCDTFESEIVYRRYFYRNAKLIANGIVTLEEYFGSSEIMNSRLGIDRRMLDFIVGLDTEFGELVEGSHLYTPSVTIDQVILPEEQKEMIVNNVLNFDKFQKAKKKLGFDDLVSYGNGMVMLFFGKSGTGKTMMANALANMLQKRVLLINYPSLGFNSSDIIIKYIFRESKLTDSIIFFDECESIFISRDKSQGQVNLLLTELERHSSLVIMATNRAFDLDEAMHRRITFAIEFKMPDPLLRGKIWKSHIPSSVKLAGDVDFNALALKYELTGGFIKNTVLTALSAAIPRNVDEPTVTMADLEQGAVNQLRGRLAMVEFERRVVPSRGLDDIIVSPEILAKLRKIVRMEKARQVLFSEWGYTDKNANDLGTTVLMYGPPGTGKTVSAEAIGFETGKPLKVINTAELVSKYVGETGKNLEVIFNEARTLDAIIVFDDAESMFGARHAEQTTSTDRYANLDTSVLLYHMERFPGIVVVTTNLQHAIDAAFMRRFRFTIEFEMPKTGEREKLWRTQVPPKAPLDKDVDFKVLAEKYKFSGGVIKNCCFKAAATAALRGTPRVLTMADLVEAAEEEISNEKGPGGNMYA